MIQPSHQQLIDILVELCEKSPDLRFGQILAHLGFLAEDRGSPGLWEVEDADLLAAMRQHSEELSASQQSVAKQGHSTES